METLDLVFWFRQLVGMCVGLAAGLLHLTGMYVLIAFFAIMITLSNAYAYKMLNVSDEDFQNSELVMEGSANSFGIFLVSYATRLSLTFVLFCLQLTWIVCFSFF